MRSEKLHAYGPLVLQLVAATLLIVASQMQQWVVLRALQLALAFVLASFATFMFGRRSAFASIARRVDWMPKSVTISENDDGVRVALVEQHSGEIVTLELPDEIDSSDAAMRFILDTLSDA